ncbi:glyoxalase [Astrocystis sublimbata]|nr:glyoxalase [Astrocystis sublimbata]
MVISISGGKIQVVRLAYVRYNYVNLEEATQFLVDFGFREAKRVTNHDGKLEQVYFRGMGPEPFILVATKSDTESFGGPAFVVESPNDLNLAMETLPDAKRVSTLHQPGHGDCVSFRDPVDGWPIDLLFGQEMVEPLNYAPHQEAVNYPEEKNRPVNETKRFEKGPAPIYKLGHFGVRTTDFEKSCEFYTSRFTFIASDIVHDANNVDQLAFFRFDRGKQQVDHHSFFIARGPAYKVHHTSYETYDFDTQLLGHDWLREKGYKSCWGVGRHVLGSQLFDYWFDPSGFVFEHYMDGDLVNADEPTHRSQAGPGTLYIWGPEVPQAFLDI